MKTFLRLRNSQRWFILLTCTYWSHEDLRLTSVSFKNFFSRKRIKPKEPHESLPIACVLSYHNLFIGNQFKKGLLSNSKYDYGSKLRNLLENLSHRIRENVRANGKLYFKAPQNKIRTHVASLSKVFLGRFQTLSRMTRLVEMLKIELS